jgi:uncharacterized integral membrane protein (TIGR00697 family)
MIGGKLIQLGPFTMSIGIIPWPFVFLFTDIINEYYGKEGVRKLTLLTSVLIIYAFILLLFGMLVNASPVSPITSEQFNIVFGQSMWIIVGSIIAFLFSQLTDVFTFWFIRKYTGRKLIWLRATGSTVVSQLIDSFIVTGIAFYLPGKLGLVDYINTAGTGYMAKLMIAVLLTPLIYLGHFLVERYLGKEEAEEILTKSAKESFSIQKNDN